MKLVLRIAIPVVLMILVGTVTVTAQKKYSRVVTDGSLWDPIDHSAAAECTGTPQVCAIKMLGELNIDVGSSPLFSVYRLGEVNEKSVTVVFVSRKVSDDDSVAGILYRLELSLGDVEDRSFTLDQLGRQFKCVRGRKGWGKQLCP